RQEHLSLLQRGARRERAGGGRRGPEEKLALQVPVGVLDVTAQLVALLRRHRALRLAPGIALVAIDVAHVVAHALALFLAHLLPAAALAPFLLRAGAGGRERD